MVLVRRLIRSDGSFSNTRPPLSQDLRSATSTRTRSSSFFVHQVANSFFLLRTPGGQATETGVQPARHHPAHERAFQPDAVRLQKDDRASAVSVAAHGTQTKGGRHENVQAANEAPFAVQEEEGGRGGAGLGLRSSGYVRRRSLARGSYRSYRGGPSGGATGFFVRSLWRSHSSLYKVIVAQDCGFHLIFCQKIEICDRLGEEVCCCVLGDGVICVFLLGFFWCPSLFAVFEFEVRG